MTSDRADAVASAVHNHYIGMSVARIYADRLLTTDDPAAVAAIAAQWWEQHPDAVLAAGVAAGVLEAENNAVNLPCGCFVHINSLHPCGDERPPKRRLVTPWREVEQP